MSIFDDIVSFLGGGGDNKDKDRSAGRGSGGNKTFGQTIKSGVDKFKSDVTMGAATFGQSYGQAAETLSEMGYSPAAIDSYISRTQATQQEQLKSMMSQRDDNDRPAPVVDTAPETTETAAPAQDIGVPKGPKPAGVAAAGAAEAEAMEAGKKGKKATIGTTMKGLTTEPETAARRSLMGLIR